MMRVLRTMLLTAALAAGFGTIATLPAAALMVEPTETETRETLDAFAGAVNEILAEAEEDPEVARNAPYTTPVRRLDEVGASRRPLIRQPLG